MPLNNIAFDWSETTNTQKEQTSTINQLEEEIDKLKEAKKQEYDTPYASINLVDDKDQVKKVKALVKKYSDINTLIVVGIGGSNLGAKAVYEATKGLLANEKEKKRVYWADTTSPQNIQDIISLTKKEKTLINVISKSGTTTESIANLGVLQEALPKTELVVTTDQESKLFTHAYEKGYDILTIPQRVGGRYSALSAVGLFPLAFLGVKIDDLVKGALDAQESCLKQGLTNPAARSAATHYLHYKRGRVITNLFLFSPQLESLGKWYRQLTAESLGKEHNLKGSVVNHGLTPIVSIGSTDLHSMAQLYLGGPDDTLTTFVTIKEDNNTRTPSNKELDKLVPNIKGKKLSAIMQAIVGGVLQAYKNKKRPYIHVTLKEHAEYDIGQFLQIKMIETMLLASLLQLDPFDQPAVEEYKKETKRLLE